MWQKFLGPDMQTFFVLLSEVLEKLWSDSHNFDSS